MRADAFFFFGPQIIAAQRQMGGFKSKRFGKAKKGPKVEV